MSGVPYNTLMTTIEAALTAVAAPGRIIDRTYRSFDDRKETDLEKGIFTLLAGGVVRYPGDWCDSDIAAIGSPTSTALPVFRFRVLGQGYCGEQAEGPDIEAFEFGLIADLEALANELVKNDTLAGHIELVRVVLKGIDQSNQLERPYCWAAALYELEVT